MEKGTIIKYTVAIKQTEDADWALDIYTIEYPDTDKVNAFQELENKYGEMRRAGEINSFYLVEATAEAIGFDEEHQENSDSSEEA